MNTSRPGLCGYLQQFHPRAVTWRRWQRAEPVLHGHDLDSVHALLLNRESGAPLKDELLGALVRIGQTPALSHTEARLATLTCLLPGLRRIAGSYRDALGNDEVWAELGVAAWQLLEAYDLSRRPRRIAANVLWDTRAHVLKAVRRERQWEMTVELDDSTLQQLRLEHLEPASSSGLRDAVHARQMSYLDATLIEATRLNGLRLSEAAALLGTSYEAAKKRRRRAEMAWASWWAPDATTRTARFGPPEPRAA